MWKLQLPAKHESYLTLNPESHRVSAEPSVHDVRGGVTHHRIMVSAVSPDRAPSPRTVCSPYFRPSLDMTRSLISRASADFSSLRARQSLSVRKSSGKRFNEPPSAEFVARVSGIPTMAKLPFQETADGLDAAFIGVPIDTGTSNRPGARFGPRQIRVESAMLRLYNSGTRAAPYESIMVADIGDVNVNVFDLKDTCKRIRETYRKVVATGCIPLTMGGDHTIAYPILQAVAEKYGPVGLIHVDAHADTSDTVLGGEDWTWDSVQTLRGGRAAGLQESGPDRPAWYRLRPRFVRMEPGAGFPCGTSGRVLVQISYTSDGLRSGLRWAAVQYISVSTSTLLTRALPPEQAHQR
ncbi:Agmatinase, mitochondrial [Larimichthys crocea]|uniref:Uncharacterized protein n=1 Tax=Larimichthys crocea TaxID=215358 RepID=A0ACD3R9Y3_LARCR|nr:Agmatinase, mitochondrial [Larimichthys crocea]